MCGILGVFDLAGLLPTSQSFGAALDRLRLRGPDDAGIWRDDRVVLGHRRLSILDLSPTGRQPMVCSDDRYVIVFNGEIYNHRELRARLEPACAWRGTSDTETLLAAYRAWGADCLTHLNGMFAFAIWDRTERLLFVARDRMGVKPLYYFERNGRFGFGSRPAALNLLRDGGSLNIDTQALSAFLDLGYIPAPLSFQHGLRKLPPGHYLTVNERGTRCVRYWDFRHIKPDPDAGARSEDDWVDELDAHVRDAVKIRLLSDVPLGAFLSGGVDSALVVACMKAPGGQVPRTFTIAFEEQCYNEAPEAAWTAYHLGVEHVHETLSVDSLLELLPAYIEEFDEPFADSSAFPTMAVARLARRHVKVVLTGDAADELFGGYHYYPLIDRLAPMLAWRVSTRRAAGRLFRGLPVHRAKLLAGALQCRDAVSLFHFLRGVGKDYSRLIHSDVASSVGAGPERWFEQYGAGFAMDLSASECAMRLDAGLTLPDLFLQKVDVATMAFSLEARCPMTDYRLVEWAMRLPLSFKIRHGGTKYLLKKLLCRYVPADQVYRPKRGFAVPLAQWLRGPLRQWAHDLIHDETLMSRVPLDKRRVRELLRQQASGERESHPLLWSVLMLLCFVQRHGAQASSAAVIDRRVA